MAGIRRRVRTWTALVSDLLALSPGPSSASAASSLRKIKGTEEKRLRESSRIERDLRTADLFVKLMGLANARGETIVLEAMSQAIATSSEFQALVSQVAKEGGSAEAQNRITSLQGIAVCSAPVGRAAQVAASQLVGSLADRYEYLRPAALRGLESVFTFLPEADPEPWRTRWSTPEMKEYR